SFANVFIIWPLNKLGLIDNLPSRFLQTIRNNKCPLGILLGGWLQITLVNHTPLDSVIHCAKVIASQGQIEYRLVRKRTAHYAGIDTIVDQVDQLIIRNHQGSFNHQVKNRLNPADVVVDDIFTLEGEDLSDGTQLGAVSIFGAVASVVNLTFFVETIPHFTPTRTNVLSLAEVPIAQRHCKPRSKGSIHLPGFFQLPLTNSVHQVGEVDS